MNAIATPLRIPLSPGIGISAVLSRPEAPRACFVFAHGAGAGMNHPFMADLAAALEARGIATLRFQFPFMEQESKRTDHPAVAQQAVRAAVDEARARLPHAAVHFYMVTAREVELLVVEPPGHVHVHAADAVFVVRHVIGHRGNEP